MTSEWTLKIKLSPEEKQKVKEALETIKTIKNEIMDMTDDLTHGARELSEAIYVLQDIVDENAI